ncbi:Uncharacterised protein [Mycobacteroides abscessus subsp. abscessus]|nr:Uncharacterised protein [Mycobacteroides abscessus subsp. abscessus]
MPDQARLGGEYRAARGLETAACRQHHHQAGKHHKSTPSHHSPLGAAMISTTRASQSMNKARAATRMAPTTRVTGC